MRREIEVSEAQELLLQIPGKPDSEFVPISEALGRVTAEPVIANLPFPPFDRSPFDGYALIGKDTVSATPATPVALAVCREIPAGHMPEEAVTTGFAAKILTGAPIPSGADAVIKFEDTEFTADEIKVFAPLSADSNIIHAGEDIPAGTEILPAGALVGPASMGLFAAQGLKNVKVFKKPVISVINTGSELTEPGKPLPPGMIYNSSIFTLQGFLTRLGAAFLDGGVVEDDEAAIAARVREELAVSDMVLTTGGVSVGDYDYALAAAERAGADVLFWKVNMRPGGSLLAYTIDGKLVLGLSGNPGAAVLGLLLLGLPCIRKLCGRSDVKPEECIVKLANDMPKASPKKRILRGHLEIQNGEALFVENSGQGGGDISSFVDCDLLAEIPAGSPPMLAGSNVKAYRVFK